MIRLLDLVGVREIEELCWNPENLRPPQEWQTRGRIDAVSIALFGVTEHDTYFDIGHRGEDDPTIDDDPAFVEWDRHFDLCECTFEEAAPVWALLGWDLTNEKGEELFCAEHFNRQIIAVVKGLVPNAKLTPDGSGTAARDPRQAEDDLATWEARLAEEVRRFKPSR